MSRLFFLILGHTFVGLGVIGIVLPGLPTTPFLILACGCYGRSSEKLQAWLLRNRLLRNWHEHRAIPRRAKVLVVTLLVAGLMYSVATVPLLVVNIILVVIVAAAACYIATRPLPPTDDVQPDAANPKR